jgi:hypothetical protein
MLQQGLSESLMGRFEATYLGHWSLCEMKEAFDITADEYVWYGGYPIAIFLKDDLDRWRAYVRDAMLRPVSLKTCLCSPE